VGKGTAKAGSGEATEVDRGECDGRTCGTKSSRRAPPGVKYINTSRSNATDAIFPLLSSQFLLFSLPVPSQENPKLFSFASGNSCTHRVSNLLTTYGCLPVFIPSGYKKVPRDYRRDYAKVVVTDHSALVFSLSSHRHSRLFTSSLSLGVPVPRGTQWIRDM
jgi:hypothetical protein